MKAIRKEPAPEPKQLGKIVKSTSAAGLALIFPLIYTGYWAYRVNKEIAEHDSSIDVDPVMSGLAFSIGGLLVIPTVISAYTTLGRLRVMQSHCGQHKEFDLKDMFTLLVTSFLFVLGLSFFAYYIQDALNEHWLIHEGEEEESIAA